MEEKQPSFRRIGIKYSLFTSLMLILYFLLMRALNLIQQPEFRYLNYALVAIGIYLALNEARHRVNADRVNYLPGLALGFWVTIMSGVIFGFFLLFYGGVLDHSFINAIRPNVAFSAYVNPGMIAVVGALEIIASGAIISFVVMQLIKRNNVSVNKEGKEKAMEKGHIHNVGHSH